jgi:hypothetical protein
MKRTVLALLAAIALASCEKGGGSSAASQAQSGNIAGNSASAPASNGSAVGPPAAQAPPPVGRFAIIHSPQVENDTMLLDTVSGKTWRLEDDSEHPGTVFWDPVTRIGGE